MIPLPDFSKCYEYENNFYLSSDPSRIGKFLIHYELYRITKDLDGDIAEAGVFKGASLVRFASFMSLCQPNNNKRIIGFDIFGKFPSPSEKDDKEVLSNFLKKAGDQSIGKTQLEEVLDRKNLAVEVELIEGDINLTVPRFLMDNPNLKLSLLNLDTDIYEPSLTVLEHLYPRLIPGGVLVLDDYGIHSGETEAVNDFFKDKKVQIKKFPFAENPSYIIKS